MWDIGVIGISVMTADLIADEAMQRGVPLHRAGTMEDIAGLTLFLASKVRFVIRF